MWPKQTAMPEVSCTVCVRVLTIGEEKVPAVVRSSRWKLYSASTSSPDSFVLVLCKGFGIGAKRWPLRKMSRPISLEEASEIRSHSSVTEVCVTFLSRSIGAVGLASVSITEANG